MQTLNQNEIEAISGGILTADKPLSQIDLSDALTLVGALGAGSLGPTLVSSLLKDTVSGPVGNVVNLVSMLAAGVLGGILSSNVSKRALPPVLGLLG